MLCFYNKHSIEEETYHYSNLNQSCYKIEFYPTTAIWEKQEKAHDIMKRLLHGQEGGGAYKYLY